MKPIEIKPKDPESRFCALDIKDGETILAEGKTHEEVIELADKTGKKYMISWIPESGKTYIF